MPSLGEAWFVILGVLLLGYAVLDGFDLGVGMIAPVVGRSEHERGLVLRTIGPVWDGNEVWLLTAGGALFAAFPLVYATVFSGFYLALVLLLAALIVRAVALEFREQLSGPRWRRGWDGLFVIASALPPLLLGVAVGNVIRGVPLDASGAYTGGLAGLLTPFPLLVGLLVEAYCVAHGAAWLVLKGTGEVQARARRVATAAVAVEAGLWVATTLAATALAPDHMAAFGSPAAWAAPGVVVGALLLSAWAIRAGRELLPLLASAATMAGMLATFGIGLYPSLLPALGDPARSLTIAGTASSELTLTVMLAIALIGIPLVLVYTAFVYWRFRGKVDSGESGY